jgi:predicted transcriptional regulator
MKIIETISKEEKIELIKEMAMYYIENKDMTLVELADTYGRPYSTVYN